MKEKEAGSSASLPAPEQAAELRKLRVDLDAETIRAQRTSSTSAPAASDLEKALRDLAEAPGSAAPLPEFGDVALPGMETIDFSCGGGLDVLKQISQQYEAQKQQAEAQLSALQQQAGGAPPQQAVVQPAAIAAVSGGTLLLPEACQPAAFPLHRATLLEDTAVSEGKELDGEGGNTSLGNLSW